MSKDATEEKLKQILFSMRSKGIALVKDAERELKDLGVPFQSAFSEEFTNRRK